MNKLFLIIFNLFIGILLFSNTVYSGKITDITGNPVFKAEIRMIEISNFYNGDILYSSQTDENGDFKIKDIKENRYIIYINKWGFNPIWINMEIFQDITLNYKLYKYNIPAKIDKVELVLDSSGDEKIYRMENKNDSWSCEINLEEGKYLYDYKINDEIIPYYDLSVKDFVYINGYYRSLKENKLGKNTSFVFDTTLYSKRNIEKEKINFEDWFFEKEYNEQILKKQINANEFLLSKIKSHKIVILGENHININPVLFLSQNIENLYKEGNLRYLFLEGDGYNKDSEKYMNDYINGNFYNNEIVIENINPLVVDAQKIEWISLYKKIDEINKKNPFDKLHVVYAEKGYDYYKYAPKNVSNYLDQITHRDLYSFAAIKKIIKHDNLKSLVFYGTGHTIRSLVSGKIWGGAQKSIYKSLGTLLSEEYKDDIYTIYPQSDNLSYFDEKKYFTYSPVKRYYLEKMNFNDYGIEIKYSGLADNNFFSSTTYKELFDGTITLNKTKYGTPNIFITSKYFMEHYLRQLFYISFYYNNILKKRIDSESDYKIAQMLYYFQVILNADFKIKYWNNDNYIEDLIKLDRWFIDNKDKFDFTLNKLDLMNRYINLIVTGYYLKEGRCYQESIDLLKKASDVLPDDVFPVCLTFSIYYNLKMYDKAIDMLDIILDNKNLMSFPDLQNLYLKISDCYKNIGDMRNSELFENKAKNLKRGKISFFGDSVNQTGVIVMRIFSINDKNNFLKIGDEIHKLNGKNIYNTEDFNKNYNYENKLNEFEITRNGKILKFNTPSGFYGIQLIDIDNNLIEF